MLICLRNRNKNDVLCGSYCIVLSARSIRSYIYIYATITNWYLYYYHCHNSRERRNHHHSGEFSCYKKVCTSSHCLRGIATAYRPCRLQLQLSYSSYYFLNSYYANYMIIVAEILPALNFYTSIKYTMITIEYLQSITYTRKYYTAYLHK